MLEKGSQAPCFRLELVDGESIALCDVLAQGHHVVLIFLRNLG
jgi:peroxiredoxin